VDSALGPEDAVQTHDRVESEQRVGMVVLTFGDGN